MEKINIGEKLSGQRIDKCLVDILKNFDIKIPSRSLLQQLIGEKVLVNGGIVKRSYKLKERDVLEIDKEAFQSALEKIDLSISIVPQKKELEIVYEDSNYIVLNKEKGMVVHPGVGNSKGTLANYIRGYLEGKQEYDPLVDRAGIVHRLDKGVSGLMVVAKKKEMQEFLKKQFQNHEVEKIYRMETKKFKESELDMLEIVDRFSLEDGVDIDKRWLTVKGYIGRSRSNRIRMEFKSYEFGGSKFAVSHFLRIGEDTFLVKIDTGRMHQIRATLFYLGRYITGDSLYTPGSRVFTPDSINLESIYLSFKDSCGEKKIFNRLK